MSKRFGSTFQMTLEFAQGKNREFFASHKGTVTDVRQGAVKTASAAETHFHQILTESKSTGTDAFNSGGQINSLQSRHARKSTIANGDDLVSFWRIFGKYKGGHLLIKESRYSRNLTGVRREHFICKYLKC